MSKQTSKSLVFGNFEVEVTSVTADIEEELSIAESPGLQEVVVGIKRLRCRTNVGVQGEPTWKDIPRSLDWNELLATIDEKDAKLKEVRAERNALRKKLKSYEVLGTAEEVRDVISNGV